MIKNLPAMQETRVQFLGWEDPLEKDTAAHSGVLAWRIPWTEEPGGLESRIRLSECHAHGLRCRAEALVAGAQWLQPRGSVVAAQGLSGCTSQALVGPVFLAQGSNKCPFHCKVDSYPPHHQGSPISTFF